MLPEHITSASESNPLETEQGTPASGGSPTPPWWVRLILALAVLTTGVLLVIVGHVNPVEVVAILVALGALYVTLVG